MRRALAIVLPLHRVSGLPWALLLAELSYSLLLVTGNRVPAPVLSALQLFLRF
ncbi:MAG: hypothetical protein ACRD1P_06305 [Thermoanaerobaculia bacterium]